MFETKREDLYFIIPTSFIFFTALFVTLWDFILIQNMKFIFNVVNILGLVLFIIGVSIRLIGKITLGKYYSYGLRTLPDHELVRRGIYKHLRHPITLAAILYSLGIPLFFSSLYGFILMLVMIPFFIYRIKIEERMLLEEFGDEYREYMKQSKKLVPYIY